MIFSAIPQLTKRKEAELIVLPFWEKQKKPKEAASLGTLDSAVKPLIDAGDFTGREGEVAFAYPKRGKEKRCLLLGLGREEHLTVNGLRQSYSNVAKECQKKGLKKINIVLPNIAQLTHVTVEEYLKGMAEGILLTNYRWESLASLPEETVLLSQITVVGILPKMLSVIKEATLIAEGVHLARDLINGNADIVTPHYLAETARKLAAKFPSLKATVFNKKRIEQEKMGLLLAVSRGSPNEPAFIILKYEGYPRSKDHTVLIGKGVTFDTGGLNLKPTGFMETMRADMSGAAAVLAAVASAAALNLKHNVTAIVAATENSIDGNSYKPGDVYKGYGGISVEVGNTDAEGRLTLADAISYCEKQLKPTRIIDFATLTGSMVVALGEQISGFFCNDNNLAHQLLDASQRSAEPLWQMPLFAPYRDLLKSDVADIKNVGGREAGAITAALFLEEFVNKVPWAHVDIAGTAFESKELGYWPKNAVGFGVRLMIDFLQHLE
ncbi:MAG: leucyl aminopeptidase [Chlamydiales bacterium]